jgi:hypothetical protein
MLVIPHRFKKIGLHNLVVRRIFSDILLALELKKVEKHWYSSFSTFLVVLRVENVLEASLLGWWDE